MPEPSNLPAQIADAIAAVPQALIPSSVKALDRLVGATVDIPVAWLAQKKARIDAQTQAYTAVEAAIAKAVATEAGATPELIERAMAALVRKEYRKSINREAVAGAMLGDLRLDSTPTADSVRKGPQAGVIDDDWLNVFERYAEDASNERMQQLWGRVIAGEVRQPGKYSLRTLRFLSEFTQDDALAFARFCENAFGEGAPTSLVKPSDNPDVRELIYLESIGLIQVGSGNGYNLLLNFDESGDAFIADRSIVLWFKAQPSSVFKIGMSTLTPLGRELMSLLPGRDVEATARRFAHAVRRPELKQATLCHVIGDNEAGTSGELLWDS